jgi:hypothetical protein
MLAQAFLHKLAAMYGQRQQLRPAVCKGLSTPMIKDFRVFLYAAANHRTSGEVQRK